MSVAASKPWLPRLLCAAALLGVASCIAVLVVKHAASGPLRPGDEAPAPATRAALRPLFPMDACPAVREAFLAMHFKDVNTSATQLHVAHLFRLSLQRRQQASSRQLPLGPLVESGKQVQVRVTLCYVLVTLLLLSALLSVVEVLLDRWNTLAGRELAASGSANAGGPLATGTPRAGTGDTAGIAGRRLQLSRRCSLVDLTVSRHERRESLAASAAHPTHVGPPGTSGASIGARPPPFSRRSSFPAPPLATSTPPSRPPVIGEESPRHDSWSRASAGSVGNSGNTTPRRRPSVDISDGDSSPDAARKRVRFIRRH